jgi:hypothetical protein
MSDMSQSNWSGRSRSAGTVHSETAGQQKNATTNTESLRPGRLRNGAKASIDPPLSGTGRGSMPAARRNLTGERAATRHPSGPISMARHNIEDYEALALRLAMEPSLLATYRNRLATNQLVHPFLTPTASDVTSRRPISECGNFGSGASCREALQLMRDARSRLLGRHSPIILVF